MKLILWIIAIMIIPGFLLWGIDISGRQKRANSVAIVNREPITYREFYSRLSDIEDRYRQIFGDKYTQIRDELDIERNILEELIREKILLQQARKRKIRVFDNEIVEAFKSDPTFKDQEGKFDEKKYKDILSRIPEDVLKKIEDEIRKAIMIEKLKNLIVSEANIKISDKDVDDFIKENKLQSEDRESVRKVLQWQKNEKYLNEWYTEIRKESKVEIYLPLKTTENKESEK